MTPQTSHLLEPPVYRPRRRRRLLSAELGRGGGRWRKECTGGGDLGNNGQSGDPRTLVFFPFLFLRIPRFRRGWGRGRNRLRGQDRWGLRTAMNEAKSGTRSEATSQRLLVIGTSTTRSSLRSSHLSSLEMALLARRSASPQGIRMMGTS